METRERIISAYNHLKDVGIISSQQNVADRMGIRKESVSKAFSGNRSYQNRKSFRIVLNIYLLKFRPQYRQAY